MIVAIEGMDGAGKTTISNHIERQFGFINIEKPCKYLYENEKGVIDYSAFYNDLKRVYQESPRVRSEYFGWGNIIAVTKYPESNVVLDRHLASNYYWNGNRKLLKIFDKLIEKCGLPDITIFLYATPDERYKRLYKRNPKDIDLYDKSTFDDGTYKHIEFLNHYGFNYVMIDTNDKTISEVCREVDFIIKEHLYKHEGKDKGHKLQKSNRK